MFGEIVHRRETTEGESIVKRKMGYTSLQFQTAAMKWGSENESLAIASYLEKRRFDNPTKDCTVTKSGLTLLKSHPFLGASGDGWVEESGEVGVLEVKTLLKVKVTLLKVWMLLTYTHANWPTMPNAVWSCIREYLV